MSFKKEQDITPKMISTVKNNSNMLEYAEYGSEYRYFLQNKKIGNEFIQQLHDFKDKHVNQSNLDLEQLYIPEKLYTYLRNHHWKNSISEEFMNKWARMEKSKYELAEDDIAIFENICEKLDFQSEKLDLYFQNLKGNNMSEKFPLKLSSSKLDRPPIQNFRFF